ncbi:Short-chain dehydrogenase/reductase SDR [Cordyceps fumosorosea ARSEF 2679]|uniref:Short-chain dehydrogenase/reductase SDR n=1 Tax=Cordyceps fumosorosea (strain ARSEF 2679) TaxID=1081104 RepID=A0A162JQ21_CORFA|nr:Short-chain dehydrogenase/reductase SDR [Cordyceps fumosorosea ARSEF 2679]OAA72092.1 Short-chain dehydrogenase/reductase SDR [Cordyceps fumosorosea ARSEF 2679]
MANASTVYVITGANRGIGLCMVQILLARPQTTVIGTVRSDDGRAQLLAGSADVVRGAGSKLISVLVDYAAGLESQDITKAFSAALAGKGVRHVDVLVANAGHTMVMGGVLETTAAQMRELYEINAIGPLVTLQGLWPLMTQGRVGQGRPGKGAYVLVSSSVGSIGMMEPVPGGAYGPSKAAANWIAKAVHAQLSGGDGGAGGVVGVAVHPGWVKTPMGDTAARSWGMPEGQGPTRRPEDSANQTVALI